MKSRWQSRLDSVAAYAGLTIVACLVVGFFLPPGETGLHFYVSMGLGIVQMIAFGIVLVWALVALVMAPRNRKRADVVLDDRNRKVIRLFSLTEQEKDALRRCLQGELVEPSDVTNGLVADGILESEANAIWVADEVLNMLPDDLADYK